MQLGFLAVFFLNVKSINKTFLYYFKDSEQRNRLIKDLQALNILLIPGTLPNLAQVPKCKALSNLKTSGMISHSVLFANIYVPQNSGYSPLPPSAIISPTPVISPPSYRPIPETKTNIRLLPPAPRYRPLLVSLFSSY